jgi:uncharacterized protein YceH (UPF0502 family)
MDLSAAEVRVLGCLIEKQRTTPDAYPLSLNALRNACNQTTNRDPVVSYDEAIIRDALHRLGRRRFTRLASGAGSRAAKYRHLLDEALGLSAAEQSVLAVLMLRGDQTPGELRARGERMHPFEPAALERLVERGFAVRLARRPGQKEERYAHLLSSDLEEEPAAAAPAAVAPPPPPAEPRDERLDRLERELAELREDVASLRRALGE